MKKTKKNSRGFTLVELLVVIVIIAIIATIAFVFSYQGYIRNSRNSIRKTDITEISNLLMRYNAKQQSYPRCAVAGTSSCEFKDGGAAAIDGIHKDDWAIIFSLMTKTPQDPKKTVSNTPLYYRYSTDAMNFEVAASLEADTPQEMTAFVKGSTGGTQGLITGGKVYNTTSSSWNDCPSGTTVKNEQLSTVCIPYNWE